MKINPLSITTTRVKRYIQNPDLSTLNKGQSEAVKLFMHFDQSNGQYFILEGWAGTGKTYVSSTLVEWLLWNKIGRIQIAMTAPVNDAVKVLRNSAQFQDDRLIFGTLHSLLGLKAEKSKDGNLVFKRPTVNHKCALDECTYLVIDEGSMLQDDLFHMIDTYYVQTGKLKVIIIGDGGQIPPIGQDYAIPFNQQERENYDMWFYELSEIVRQAEGHPIIEFTTKLRKNLNRPNPIVLFNTNVIEGNKGLVFLNGQQGRELGQTMRALFTSEYFKENPNYAKIICWRKVYVAKFNSIVRGMIFGQDLPKIVIGEKMVASDSITDGYDTFLMTNGTKFEVLELSIDYIYPMGDDTKFKYYNAKVQCEDLDDTSIKFIKILHEDSEQAYNAVLEKMGKLAKDEPDGSIRMKLWNKYWDMKRFFADVSYNYAITAHRSQGSTYQYAIVIMEDIYSHHNLVKVRDRNRIGYTACTRPSDMLIMVGDL